MKILIADDHDIVRQGLETVLNETFKSSVIELFDNFDSVAEALKQKKYDLLILDFNMPGGNNFQMIRTVKLIQPDARVLIFSTYSEASYGVRCLQAGASGYLHKECSRAEILTAVHSIMERNRYLSPAGTEYVMQTIQKGRTQSSDPFDDLSTREMEVVNLLVQGLGLLEIADNLKIQITTASTYKRRVFEKLGIANIAELISLYNSR